MDAKGLIQQIARKRNLSIAQVTEIVQDLLDGVEDCLSRHEPVILPEFGQFAVKKVPPWLGRHPQTGEMMKLPGKNVPFFKSDSELRKRLNGGRDWQNMPPMPRPPGDES
ncbi:histone family protein DNA-binding protein [Magnetococcus marinus MC-1]|uniref:Histone family protein DNA-binding protein n=1 Tax=Magnetococcus marinus (strain ATCC BAA-1437 / JCM 17883 / MC-1) TaxID=156889 RepID=A0L9H9_MAGMM|nr:HU family DNA-binding protein [Magnetococcus marinus]ABK44622.1 histone family protein DNA-binding protein [Magnetococcus marinus MC-1]